MDGSSFLAAAPLASILAAGSDVPGRRNLVERQASFDANAFAAMLGKRADIAQLWGGMFLACHTAVEERARALVAAGHAPAGMSGRDAAADILAN